MNLFHEELIPSNELSDQAFLKPVSGIHRRNVATILANEGFTLNAISIFIGCSISTTTRSLKSVSIIDDCSHSGCPATYSETIKLQLIGFYCQTQPFQNAGRWTLRLAEAYLAANPDILNATPSKSTIHRVLKENNLKPHQSRYFLQITDPNFFPKMDHLITLYLNPPKNLFFFDECPGIQILKRLFPDFQTENTNKSLKEFEYSRNGTIDVFAFFNYADGKVYAECRANHKTDTFLEVFQNQVACCPVKEQLHYVMDNLSTHRGYPFCKTVAELSNVDCPSESELNTLEKRVEWLKSTDKRIVIHFTPYHGSWLNLVEFWFGIMNKKVLNESYGSAVELMKSFDVFLETWNDLLAHPFRWSYDGKGLHEKAIKRFIKILSQGNKLTTAVLTKQLLLMVNLFNDYFLKVPEKYWDKLFNVLRSQEETLRKIIENEKGPLKKKKAKDALNLILSVIEDYIWQNVDRAA